LVLSNNRLKDLNSWLKKRVKSLEEDLEKEKSDFEKLENHLKNNKKICVYLTLYWPMHLVMYIKL